MTVPNRENPDTTEERHSKAERLEASITHSQKELLQLAADIEGRTLTDFVVSSATAKAIHTIEEHTIIKLSRKDSLAFVESLLNPPDPDPRMVEAALKYKQSMGLE